MDRIYAEIDLKQLVRNLQNIKKLLSPQTSIMGIIKADAYGHGVKPIAQILHKEGVNYFGVASVDEAIELREAGIKCPILVLSEPSAGQLKQIIKYNLVQTIYSNEFLKSLTKLTKKIRVHVKVDTGMTRIGVMESAALDYIAKVKRNKKIQIEGLFTHLACADQPAHPLNSKQLSAFQILRNRCRKEYPEIKYYHAANSAAVNNFKEAHFDLVRVGIALYKNVLTLKARVNFVKTVQAGIAVSYGATYQTKQETKIATISAGYADGFNRLLSNKGQVIIRGKIFPVIGNVCMDMFMVDVTGSDVSIGDEAVLIGKDGGKMITAEAIAESINTIDYEVLCGISKRVPRIYKK